MSRALVTQVFPFLLPIRLKQRKSMFYLEMKLDGFDYAKSKCDEYKNIVYETKSKLINDESGFDIIYQYNKVHNLKLAAKTINKIIIKPNEVFSFWLLVKEAQKEEKFKPGLNLIRGKVSEVIGGGLCQLSCMLYEMFLHTKLTTIERKGHDSLSVYNPDLKVKAIDATINEGWIDLKMKNDTNDNYQIVIEFDDEYMYGKILTLENASYKMKVFNNYHRYYKENEKVYLLSSVDRYVFDTKEESLKVEHLYTDRTRIEYDISLINEKIERR